MNKNIIVLGEIHQDLHYESNFYEEFVEKIADNVANFLKYNPDDVNKKILEKLVKKGIENASKKVIGCSSFKRGGNGNNSAECLAHLGIPTKLISIVGRGNEWIYAELKKVGVNTDTVFQIDEITPVNTIIKSKFASKILLSPNLQDKMSFEGIDIKDNVFDNAKIIFTTPIAKKFVKIFENSFNFDLITAFKIEKQNASNLEELSELIKKQYDIFFLNLIDAQLILNEKLTIEEIDKKFQSYAKIRTYTNGKDGSYIFTDNFNLRFPDIELKEVTDHTSLEDFYSAGFLIIIYEIVENKFQLLELLKHENDEKLKSILNLCGKFATYAVNYKITKQKAPTTEEIKNFMKDFKIN